MPNCNLYVYEATPTHRHIIVASCMYILRFQQECSFDWDMDCDMDQDWLNTFFDDPVLNDRMISDASNIQPQVQSEHSYSMATSDQALDMTIYSKSGSCLLLHIYNLVHFVKMVENGPCCC